MTNTTSNPLSIAGRHAPLLFAVLMGALGALINLFPLPLGPGVELVIGNFVYIVTMLATDSAGHIIAASPEDRVSTIDPA